MTYELPTLMGPFSNRAGRSTATTTTHHRTR
jgi:hypothetical protein